MSRVLVTGIGGYLGSVLTGYLLAAGHHVTGLDTFRHSQNSLAAYCSNSNFNVVNGDCRDMGVMRPLIAQADIILPLAAIVGAKACDADQSAAITTNRNAIYDLCGETSADQWIIIPTTNSGYGVGGDGFCTEDSPLNPISLYGRTKVDAEAQVVARRNSISLRLATVFGASPRMRMDLLVNSLTWKAVSEGAAVIFEGHFRRNYISVTDVARTFLHAIDNFDTMRGKVYNVGLNDANLSKLELCERIKRHVPHFAIIEAEIGHDEDKRDYIVDNSRLEATGWKPEVSLDDGIQHLLKLYRTLQPNRYSNA